MTKLSQKQQDDLAYVDEADDRWRRAKKNALIEARRIANERIEAFSAERDKAVYAAIQSGVPMSRIAREGLHTSPAAPYEILERMQANMATVGVELSSRPVDAFSGYIIMKSAGQDVYLAIQDASNPDAEFTLGNGITYPGFKVVLDTQSTPVRPMDYPEAVSANHPAAVWAVDNWKNLPTKPYGDTEG